MAIQVENYNFKGIQIKDATIKVARIFGNSKQGWDSLVIVSVENKDDIENPILEEIESFNFQAPFKENERGYKTVYLSLMDKFGGVEI